MIYSYKIEKIKSKPTGIPGITKQGKSFITFGADYMNWKADQVLLVRVQKERFYPELVEPLSRVCGAFFRIVLPVSRKGHQPDLYNLVGSFADILTQAGCWQDDNVLVSDLCTIRVLFNNTKLSTVSLYSTTKEYSDHLRDLAEKLDLSEKF